MYTNFYWKSKTIHRIFVLVPQLQKAIVFTSYVRLIVSQQSQEYVHALHASGGHASGFS